MEFWKSLSGMMVVEFTSAAPEIVLDAITKEKIQISNLVQKDELTYQIQVSRKNYRTISAVLRKNNAKQKLLSRKGIFWEICAFAHRPVLLCFFFFLLLSSVFLPSRIFFITVDGNETIPDRLILSAAEECGIRFAVSRRAVRSEKVKNALLAAVPQLQWAGVNTKGCTAVISVRERTETESSDDSKMISNLVAERDGYILSATVTDGTACVLPGETVTKGELLISGYTDCDFFIQASRARGEILALTSRDMKTVMPVVSAFPQQTARKKYRVGFLVGKKRINLWKDSRISGACCGRMYEEYYVSLPGGFELPVGWYIDQYVEYELQETEISETDAQHRMQQFSEDYLIRQMVAGKINRSDHDFTCHDGLYQLDSAYICTEMIGTEQRVQIGEFHEQRN